MEKRRLLCWVLYGIGLGNYFIVLRAQDTFSIVAVDPRTHEIGSAGASCIDNSLRISDIIEGVGAIHTQAFYLAANQQTAHNRMLAGDSPQQIIDYVVAHDVDVNPSIRQYGVVDLVGGGRSAAYTGVNTNDYKNHITGSTYSIQGNILLGQVVLDTMEYAFLHTSGSLADKLMASLKAAKIPGADTRCLIRGLSSLSSFIRVVRVGDGPNQCLFRDVNFSTTVDPLDSLQTLYDAWKDSLANQPDPYLSSVIVDKDTLFDNGIDQATITITVRNNSNVPLLSALDVQIVHSGAGTLSALTPFGNGVYVAHLTSPNQVGTDAINVTVTATPLPPIALLDAPVVVYITPIARTWRGIVDSLWTNLKNWSPKGIPAYFDNLVIPPTANPPVYRDTTRQINITSLSILTGGSLTVTTPDVHFIITQSLTLHGQMLLQGISNGRHSDSIFIPNPAPDALIGEGEILTGTIQRAIQQGAIGVYQFHSSQSFVQFDGSGVYPSQLTITPVPDTPATSFANFWVVVPSVANSSSHSVSTASVSHFSDWYFGTPGPLGGVPRVRRVYHIESDGGSSFRAQLSLGYSPSEVDGGVNEDSLQLLREGSQVVDTISYRTFTSEDFALAKDNAGKLGKPVKRGSGMPNAVNVLEETFQQGIFPGNPMGDTVGGIVIGVSYPRLIGGKFKPDPDSSKKYGWLRLGKWDVKKAMGKNFKDLLKTLYKAPMLHDGTPRNFDFVGEKKGMPPTKHNNKLLAEQVALKANILASLLEKIPLGINSLVYNDGTTNPLNGKAVSEIAQRCDSFLTSGKLPPGVTAALFYSTIRNINLSFEGPIDTESFASKLKLKAVRALAAVPYLHSTGLTPSKISPMHSFVEDEPMEFNLHQNFPNPFNPTTMIQFDLPSTAAATLKIYDVLGRQMITLLDHEVLEAGEQEVEFNAANFPSGVYFYRFVATSIGDDDQGVAGTTFVRVKKMLLLK